MSAVVKQRLGAEGDVADAGAVTCCLINRPAIFPHHGSKRGARGRIGSQLVPDRFVATQRKCEILKASNEAVEEAVVALGKLNLTAKLEPWKRPDFEPAVEADRKGVRLVS